MDLEYELLACFVSDDEDVGLFADANLVAHRVDCVVFLVGVQGEVVQAPVCEAVAVILN